MYMWCKLESVLFIVVNIIGKALYQEEEFYQSVEETEKRLGESKDEKWFSNFTSRRPHRRGATAARE